MITAVILTKNEEDRIKTCLESVKWVDEIIIIDSYSQDKTVEIAKKFGAKIFQREFDNYVNQKNWAAEKVSGEWVIYIDADERILEPLKNEIKEIISNDKYNAFAISRKNVIFGKEEKYGSFWPDWVIRLVRKNSFKKWVGEIHEHMEFEGKLGYTKNSFLHLTHRDVDQIILKNLEWSKIDAKLRFDAKHPKMSAWRFLRILFSELFYQGVIRKGFFSGSIGTMDALLQTFSLLTTYMRLWELQQHKPLKEVYEEIDEKLIKEKFNF